MEFPKYIVEAFFDDVDLDDIVDNDISEIDEFDISLNQNPNDEYKNLLIISIQSIPKKYYKNKAKFFETVEMLQREFCEIFSDFGNLFKEWDLPIIGFSDDYYTRNIEDLKIKFSNDLLRFNNTEEEIDKMEKCKYLRLYFRVNLTNNYKNSYKLFNVLFKRIPLAINELLSTTGKGRAELHSIWLDNFELDDLNFNNIGEMKRSLREFQEKVFGQTDDSIAQNFFDRNRRKVLHKAISNYFGNYIAMDQYTITETDDEVTITIKPHYSYQTMYPKNGYQDIQNAESLYNKKIRFDFSNCNLRITLDYRANVKDISMYTKQFNGSVKFIKPDIKKLMLDIVVYSPNKKPVDVNKLGKLNLQGLNIQDFILNAIDADHYVEGDLKSIVVK